MKSEAALRQLEVATDLLISDADPLAVRTLAAAAEGILADFVERPKSGASWRARILADSAMSKSDALSILSAVQNHLKHAYRDPDDDLSFEEEESHHVLFVATPACSELRSPLTKAMQAFQIWYLASHSDSFESGAVLVQKASAIPPGLA